ncbi:hypothetical protein B0H16DRAFT_1700996 [Mycena metata]|uniref:Uncharacterized protein n=1 Tax=Mycena metata TaxID=1033252 RepID=A0AAD7MH96_9AGAR|nr:hypothetical protein B0H16DRAFT_1700996 [Mycena metata]
MSRIRRRIRCSVSLQTRTELPRINPESAERNQNQKKNKQQQAAPPVATGLFVVDKWWIFNVSTAPSCCYPFMIKKLCGGGSRPGLDLAPAQSDLDDSTRRAAHALQVKWTLPTLAHPPFVSPSTSKASRPSPALHPLSWSSSLPGSPRKCAVPHPGCTPPKSTLRIGFNRKWERREGKGLLSTRQDQHPQSFDIVARRTSNGSLRLPGCIATLRLYAGIVSASFTKGRQIHTGCLPWRARISPNLIHTSPPAPFLSPPSLCPSISASAPALVIVPIPSSSLPLHPRRQVTSPRGGTCACAQTAP